MIHEFMTRRVIFPTKWANEIVRWIQGIRSPNGTIKIKNTLTPTGTGPEFDVNIETVAAKVAEILDARYIKKDNLRSYIDGSSIVANGGILSVSADFVKRAAV